MLKPALCVQFRFIGHLSEEDCSAVLQEDAVSCLVLGTESSQALVLNAAASAVTATWHLKHVPAFLCASGKLKLNKPYS